jgi:hypothetical protein
MEGEKQWKSIWKIKAPGKMKIHLWQFLTIAFQVVINCRSDMSPTLGRASSVGVWRRLIMLCYPANMLRLFGERLKNASRFGWTRNILSPLASGFSTSWSGQMSSKHQ